MIHRPAFTVLVVLLFGCLVPIGVARGAEAMSEADKIKAMISSVENLKDASFIRNGKAYEAKEAADHLRAKWDGGKAKIKTAREFIKHAASKSSISGQAYKIRFKDGTEKTSETFLTEKLDEIEK